MMKQADEVIKERFDLLKNRQQNNLQTMEGCELIFDCVHLLYINVIK